jgi:hypothetical protein
MRSLSDHDVRRHVNGAPEIDGQGESGAEVIPTRTEKAMSNSLPDEEGAMPDEDGVLPGQNVDPDLGTDTTRAADSDDAGDEEEDVDLSDLP